METAGTQMETSAGEGMVRTHPQRRALLGQRSGKNRDEEEESGEVR
jgi:hypothetical protein